MERTNEMINILKWKQIINKNIKEQPLNQQMVWISHSPEVKSNNCLFWPGIRRWGYMPRVECPFKLFTAQSGVFFSSDLKMGIRGHSFFLAGSPFPLFLQALTLPISFTNVIQDAAVVMRYICACVQTLRNKMCPHAHALTPSDAHMPST